MNSGKLRHRIQIDTKTTSYNSYKELTEVWIKFADRYADIISFKAKEMQNVPKERFNITHKVKIRYCSGLTAKMRIVWGIRIFNIIEVLADRTDKKFQELLCIEQV